MNIYICSTVRHLLFSLLKATYEQAEPSHIVFFYDYQDIDKSSFNTSVLPAHITISLLSRRDLNQQLSQTAKGRAYRFLAMRNAYLPTTIKQGFTELLGREIPTLAETLRSSLNLFVFNEQNKMARLFRLLTPSYQMIEDGMANYTRKKTQKYKWLPRLLQGKTPTYHLYGESKRCKTIYAVTPEAIPEEIRDKAKPMDFIAKSDSIEFLNPFFGYQPQQSSEDNTFIIATQPVFHKPVLAANYHFEVYAEVITQLKAAGVNCVIKTHPSEDPESYRSRFPDIPLAPSKLPLELLLLGNKQQVNILSICSSAGLGFEQLCHKIDLIEADKISESLPLMKTWQKAPETLQSLINDKIQPYL